jgi:UDP-N-acetylmuramoyl-tripeptide--D-alanyl-D-alanine ligase
MRYRLRDTVAVLRTPVGRSQVLSGVYHRAWPVMSRLAALYRRTALSRTSVVAVVGTYGKTTTARALTRALGRSVHPDLELNDRSFIPWSILRTEAGARHAVVEVGIDHAGQMLQFARVVRPAVCVVTSVGSEHNRSLGTLAVARHEKAQMVRAVPDDGLVVLNRDDENVMWMATQTRARALTFGFHPDSDFRAAEPRLNWPSGTEFRLFHGGEARVVRTRLLGHHMVYPALAAAAVAAGVGVHLDDAIPRIQELPPTPGRMELMPLENGAALLCDYFKSGLETIYAALNLLESIPAPRKIVVLGDVSEPPGPQGPIYKAIGRRVAEVASVAVFLSSQNQAYSSGASTRGMPHHSIHKLNRSVLQAAEFLRGQLAAGDVVLIKGRDTQRLDRIAFALAGREVKCDLSFCRAMPMRCANCGMLERGWDGLKIVF